MDFASKYKYLQDYASGLVEQFCRAELVSDTSEAGDLAKACAYSLFPPGKCLRATILLAVAEMYEVRRELLTPVVLAMETLHIASLIHDDLPSLDNDSLRRGRATSHVIYGEATAILAADRLFAISFQILMRANELSAQARVELCDLFTSALIDLCDGQLMDLQDSHQAPLEAFGPRPKSDLSEENQAKRRLELRHRKKTGALIFAATTAPFALVEGDRLGESAKTLEKSALGEYGHQLGMVFQITDDILDVTSTTDVVGKTVGKDVSHHVPTYVSIYGLEASKTLARAAADRATASLSSFGPQADYLRWLVEFVHSRTM